MNSTAKFVVISAVFFWAFNVISPPAEAATSVRIAAMASAKTQKGAKYVYGREGGYSRGYDCSGLIKWAYKQRGKTLPRTAQEQYNRSKHIAYKDRKPGDLIFIAQNGHVYHVGIYTGMRNGVSYMVNANSGSYRGRKVVEAPVKEYTAGSPYALVGQY